jgi:ATP-dependent helicase HrpA
MPLTAARFTAMCEAARKELPLTAHRVRDALKLHDEWRRKLAAHPRRYTTMQHDMDRLLPPDVLLVTPHTQLAHLPRYLRAIELRADRAHSDPAKDLSKQRLIDDFKDWRSYVLPTDRETFRWLLEEYRVQVFAPELGTAAKVSPKRLEELLGG